VSFSFPYERIITKNCIIEVSTTSPQPLTHNLYISTDST